MKANVKTLGETVTQLPSKDRAYLAERLLTSLEDEELDRRWADETKRRRDEVRSGRVKPIPADEVYEKIARLLGE